MAERGYLRRSDFVILILNSLRYVWDLREYVEMVERGYLRGSDFVCYSHT